jgi:hypothetical protein
VRFLHPDDFDRGARLSCSVQAAHHRKMGFDAEFLTPLKKHGMEFDPEFIFG